MKNYETNSFTQLIKKKVDEFCPKKRKKKTPK